MPPTDDIEQLKAEARDLAKTWALHDLKFYLETWADDAEKMKRLEGGAIDYTRKRQIIRDILADLAD
jgi:hypothetical protein